MTEEPLRVLLVDDDTSLRESLTKRLWDGYGYYVDAAAGAEEAWQQVVDAERHYDVALIDDLLTPGPGAEPEPVGIDLMRRLKERCPETECVIFTGWGMARALEALQAGAYRYLAKPLNLDELGMTIRTAAEHRRLRQQLEATKQEKERLQVLLEIGQATASVLGLDEMLEKVHEWVGRFMDASCLDVILYDENSQTLRFQFGYDRGKREDKWKRPFTPGQGLTDWVIEHRQPLLIKDCWKKVLPVPAYQQGEVSRSWLGVPLMARGRVSGAITVQSYEPHEFDETHQQILTTLASQMANAIENARLFSESTEIKDRLDALIASSFDAVIAIDQDKKITVFNRMAEQVLGRSATVMIGQTVAPLHADIEKARELFDAVNRDGAISGWNVELKHSNGTTIPVLLSAALIRNSQGYPIGQAGFMRDLRQVNLLEERLRALMEVTQTVTSVLALDDVLDLIVKSAVAAFPTAQAGIIHLYDERAGVLRPGASTYQFSPKVLEALSFKAGEGIAGWVYEHRKSLVVDDVRQDPRYKRIDHHEMPAHKSIICVPLRAWREVIGTLSLDNPDIPAAFLPEDLGLLRSFADQAAIAIENARRMHELEQMRQAAEAMARAFELRQALEQIVDSACQVLQADSSAIWSYDEVSDQFVPEELVMVGVPPDELERVRGEELRPGRTADMVMREGYVVVTDISQPEYDFVGQPTRDLMSRIGGQSFQGVALRVGGERLGVLYVNYNRVRTFDERQEETLRTFANHAVLTLKNARLLEQVSKARDTAKVVAEVSVLEDLRSTLSSIVRGTQEALHCDAVTLYTYDQSRCEFGFPPEIVGVRDAEIVLKWSLVVRESVLRRILARDEPYVAEDAPSDPVVGGTFVEREDIRSSISLPLKVGDRKVGVMFVNYRSLHRFTEGELTNIELFAYQAAVAIRNAQLYESERKRVNALQALYEASQAVTGALTLDELLTHIVEQAWRLAEPHGEKTHFSHLALVDGGRVRFAAAYPSEMLKRLQDGVCEIDLEGDARIGITGRVVVTRQSQLSGNVLPDPDYIETDPRVHSQLGVPIKMGEQVIGVINVEHPDYNAFTQEDQWALEALAAQAAMAIQDHRQLRLREGLLKVGEVVTAAGELYPALELIAESVKGTLGCDVVCLYTYDDKKREISYPSVVVGGLHKPDERADWRLVSQERKLRVDLLGEHSVIRGLMEYGFSRFASCSSKDPILGVGQFVGREKIASSAGILLKVGEEVMGILFANYRSAHRFSEEEKQAAELFAYQAAVAIRNAQLVEEMIRKANALEALYEAGKTVTSTLALDEILNRIVEQAWSFTCHYGKRARLSNLDLVEGHRLKRKAAYPPEHLAKLQRIVGDIDLDLGKRIGVIGRAVRTGRSQLVGDVTQDPDYIEYDPETRSELAVPIKLGEEVIGAINVEHPDYNAFDKDDRRDMESLATQAAIAIENARLFRETEHRALQLAAASEVARDATAILDVERLLDEAVWRISERFGFYHAGVFLLDDKREYAVLHAASSEGGRCMLERGHKLKVGEVGIVGFVTDTGEPRIALDVGQDAVHFSNPDLPDTRSEMAVPLAMRGQVIGALDVQSTDVSAFTDGDVATLQIIADHLANAIENARLYEKLQQEAKQLSLINQIAAEISSTLDLDKTLQTLVDELARVMKAEQCALAIFDEREEYGDVVAEYLEDGCVPSTGVRIPLRHNPAIEVVRQTRKPLAVRDAQHDPRMEKVWDIMKQRRTQSIMIVPIVIGGKVIGTIGVDAVSNPRDFTREEQWLAETIAHHASIAIQNARRYEELRRTKGLVGARTALAWMGMASSAWRHAVGNYAITIQDLVDLARRDMAAGAAADRIRRRLGRIEDMANKIRVTPITAPLHTEEGVRSVAINELLRERIRQLWGREPYGKVQVEFDLSAEEPTTVRASPDWLRRAFDILIENAVEAMADSATRRLTVATQLTKGGVELSITDTGDGVPDEVVQRLFRAPIPRPKGSKGLGVGLLMAHTIVQTYGGDIWLGSTGPSGTTMIIWLPAES